jgi:limonene-1,2-epoxide hydrolase
VSESPESVVRKFLAAWTDPRVDQIADFFDEDASWVDGPQGVRRGAKAIVDELMSQLSISRGIQIEVDTLVASDGTVMVEWHGEWTIDGSPISAMVMAVFIVENGRIQQWRESYDLKSVVDQIEAASRKGG